MLFLKHDDIDLETKLKSALETKLEQDPKVVAVVDDIIQNIQIKGDAALFEYTKQFDGWDIDSSNIKVSKEQIDKLANIVPKNLIKAMEHSAERIESYHQKQMPEDHSYQDEHGNKLGWRWTPVDATGLYVPGGKATYPSSVLMNAIPARVAGVSRVAMAVPTPNGELNPAVMAAAKIAGITEIYRIGGAQAIAALAYGTDSISPVNCIVGPGNAYVAAAKKQVFGKIGIDSIAGPSEILVIADDSANAAWVAADLLSQAEHDEAARSILITTSQDLADNVINEVEQQIVKLKRHNIASASWNNNGIIVLANSLEQAAHLSNIVAPEHLELCVNNPEELSELITHAGAIFIGHHTPEAMGDYIAGPSHVLPTAGCAAYASGLGVYDFLKRSSIISCSEAGFKKLSQDTITFAESEGLTAHAESIKVRQPV